MAAPRAVPKVARLFGLRRPAQASTGNRIRLLESGREFFPALLAAIRAAQRSIHLETYIFADEGAGREVLAALSEAVGRGVQVRVLVDGFGSGAVARVLAAALPAPGGQVRVYRPARWWGPHRRAFRRLHRKIAVIDGREAFVGGINIDGEPARDEVTGELIGARLDFAVACEGPVAAAVSLAARRLWWAVGLAALGKLGAPAPRRPRAGAPLPGGVRASLVLRDNLRHRGDIERSYLGAIRAARRQILIACAYFQPGRRFRRALVRAARRGVRVRLLLQGRVEYRVQHRAQRAWYGQLLREGIEIYEYRRSYLHAKVAVIDDDWATVGSSNIDPFSLLLAREANVVVHDRDFASRLRGALERAIEQDSRRLDATWEASRPLLSRVVDWMAYGFVRAATLVLARSDGGY